MNPDLVSPAGLQSTFDQRRVVELRLAGLKGDEIATILGKRRNAVDALQFRAIARMRQVLHEHSVRRAAR